jgi:hypothetical protein
VIRLVDAELAADVGDRLEARHFSGQHIGRIAADPVEQHEHQQHDPEHRGQHLPQAAQQEWKHE